MNSSLLKNIKFAIQEAESQGLKIETEGLTGYSGKKMVGCLQRLSQLVVDKNNCYLEVGVFQGMTLLSVANALDKAYDAYGIDNFAFFDKDGKNYGIVKERRERLGLDNAKVINLDYEDALNNLSKYVN